MKEDIVQYLINVKDPNISYKSQQFGDAELSDEDKRDIVTNLLDNRKFSEFFSRFGQFLNEHHLRYFDEISESDPDKYVIKTMVRDLLKSRTSVSRKNRRFNAANDLMRTSNYFSEHEMMKRDPKLYDKLIGRYLDRSEIEARNQSMLNDSSVFDLLMDADQMKLLTNFNKPPHAAASGQKRSHWGEMSKKNHDDDDDDDEPVSKISAAEKARFRKEFETQMVEQFLNGQDSDFDYNMVDANQNYDDEIQNRDFEDLYFDSEEAVGHQLGPDHD